MTQFTPRQIKLLESRFGHGYLNHPVGKQWLYELAKQQDAILRAAFKELEAGYVPDRLIEPSIGEKNAHW